MDIHHLSRLPDPVKAMVTEIETVIGSEITIRPKTSDDLKYIADSSVATAHVNLTHGVFTASIACQGIPATRVIVHELLHIHRQVVQTVPALISNQDLRSQELIETAKRLENDLEHYYVIPQEIAFCPEGRTRWESHYDTELNRVDPYVIEPDPSKVNMLALREALLRDWLVTATALPQWQNLHRLQSMLQRKGWLGDAERLVEKVNRVKLNKSRCMSALLRFIGYDTTHFWQNRYDMLTRQPVLEPLPLH